MNRITNYHDCLHIFGQEHIPVGTKIRAQYTNDQHICGVVIRCVNVIGQSLSALIHVLPYIEFGSNLAVIHSSPEHPIWVSSSYDDDEMSEAETIIF